MLFLVWFGVANGLVSPQYVLPSTGRSSALSLATVSSDEGEGQQRPRNKLSLTTFETAALVTGAAVGGGFLALPRACNGVGILPSTVALVGAWGYMTLSSLALAEGTLMTLEARRRRAEKAALNEQDDEDEDDELVAENEGASIFAVVTESLGKPKSLSTRLVLGLASTCFVLGTMASLSSQIAKVRSLASTMLPAGAEPLATAATAVIAYALSFGVSPRFAEQLSAILSVSMVAAFATLVKVLFGMTVAAPAAGGVAAAQQATAAAATNWGALVPWAAAARGGDPWPFMLFCNILCFGEVVAIACRKLYARDVAASEAVKAAVPSEEVKKTEPRRRNLAAPLVLGGAVPLLMALTLVVAAAAIPAVSVRDPLDMVLSLGNPLETASVVAFAACAIATTTIGTLLAVSQFLSDLVCARFGFCSVDQRRLVRVVSIVVPTLISYLHEDLFYKALAFAGGFPVVVLWGILPVFLLDKLRRRRAAEFDAPRILPGGRLVLTVLKFLGVNLLALNTFLYLKPLF